MLRDLLEQISRYHTSPIRLSHSDINQLVESKEKDILIKQGILKDGEPYGSLVCEECFEHTVEPHYSDEGIYAYCENFDGGKFFLDRDKIVSYIFDLPALLNFVCTELNVQKNIKIVAKNILWSLGRAYTANQYIHLFYCQNEDFQTFVDYIESFPTATQNFLLFTNTSIPKIQMGKKNLIVIPLTEIIKIGKGISVDKDTFQKYLKEAFLKVTFHKTGDLVVNGEKIADILPQSAEYFFTQTLYENFETVVNYNDIYSYCTEKLKRNYADTAENFCHKMKSNIKKKSLQPNTVEKLFDKGKDKNGLKGYRMTTPS